MKIFDTILAILCVIFCLANSVIGMTTDDPHIETLSWIKCFGWFFMFVYFSKESQK